MAHEKQPVSRARRLALAGGAALVLGGVAAGSVAAQTPTPGVRIFAPDEHADVVVIRHAELPAGGPFAEHHEKWLQTLASKLGVTQEKLKEALEATNKELGLPMVAPLMAMPAAEAVRIEISPGHTAAAKALGISEEQLRKEWIGKSLTELARARNVDPKVVADAMKAQRVADLDKAVADGKLPAEMAARLKSHLDTEIQHLMEIKWSEAGGANVLRFEHHVEERRP